MSIHDPLVLKQQLGSSPLPTYTAEDSLVQAAVLIVIYPEQDGPHVILTRRSQNMSSHAGQISFPGGRADPGEVEPVITAVREAEEEIALPPDRLEIIGGLDKRCSSSGFCISPVIAWCDELPPLQASPHEVDEIIPLPLTHIIQDGMFHVGTKVKNDIKREFYILDYKNYYIWGLTAGLLRDLAMKLK
jgi:8-oxo-dGTP pyrophosphatase MutT (NUDIX family)